jgi:hypothetical protein
MTQLTLFEVEQPQVEMLTWYRAHHRNGMLHFTSSEKADMERYENNPEWKITVDSFPRPKWYNLK